MIGLKSRRTCRACSPEDYGPCTCLKDCGHLSCTGSRRETAPAQAPAAPDYGTRLDVEMKLAEIAATMRQEAARPARPPWITAPQPAAADLLAGDANALYGWDITRLDVPPSHDRPFVPGVLGSDSRLSPRRAGVAEDLAAMPLFRFSVERMARPCCERCQQAAGDWRDRLYGTFRHHTGPVDGTAPRQFGIATELRQLHGEYAADADDAEAAFARRYLIGRAA